MERGWEISTIDKELRLHSLLVSGRYLTGVCLSFFGQFLHPESSHHLTISPQNVFNFLDCTEYKNIKMVPSHLKGKYSY